MNSERPAMTTMTYHEQRVRRDLARVIRRESCLPLEMRKSAVEAAVSLTTKWINFRQNKRHRVAFGYDKRPLAFTLTNDAGVCYYLCIERELCRLTIRECNRNGLRLVSEMPVVFSVDCIEQGDTHVGN